MRRVQEGRRRRRRLRWVGIFVNPSCNNSVERKRRRQNIQEGMARPSQIRDPNRCRLR